VCLGERDQSFVLELVEDGADLVEGHCGLCHDLVDGLRVGVGQGVVDALLVGRKLGEEVHLACGGSGVGGCGAALVGPADVGEEVGSGGDEMGRWLAMRRLNPSLIASPARPGKAQTLRP
jgi:hypothetical protein